MNMPQDNIETAAAVRFLDWLRETRLAHRLQSGVDVPCGSCNACCRSSYFIHIQPQETEALAHIPADLLFPAPGLPQGNMVMGFNAQGCCPMLIDNRCSIYAHRPLTCRIYDCRLFAAAGLDAGGQEKALVNQQLPRWTFDYPEPSDQEAQQAVREVVQFIQTHAHAFPGGRVPQNPSHLAILAVKAYTTFLPDQHPKAPSHTERAAAIIEADSAFETSSS